MKKILVTVMFVVAVAAAGAQDSAQSRPEQPRALLSQAPSANDSAVHDMHADTRDFRADGTPPESMGFERWEFIFSKGSQEDRNWLWSAIKGKVFQMRGTVIKATAAEVDIAVAHNIDGKNVDVKLIFQGPISAHVIPRSAAINFTPKEGTNLDFQGVISSYTRNPFILTMEKGELCLPILCAESTAAHKPASK